MGITVSTFGILGGIKEFTRKNKQYEVIEMPDGMKQNLEKMYAKGYVKVRIDKNKFEVIARNIIAKKRVTKVRPDLQTALYMPLVNFNLAIDPEKDDKTKEITILVPRILSDPKNLRLLAPLSPGNQSQLFEQIDSYGKFYKGPTADPVDVL
jgi:hypothetical protein